MRISDWSSDVCSSDLSLRALLGVQDIDYNDVKREQYTFFSYRACEIGFRENQLFSSEGYNESPGVRSVGTTILSMTGKPHKRLRSAAQPLFKRPKVLDRSEEHTSELQSLMRISYAVFC